MTTLTFQKNIPEFSDYYSTGGDITITLSGVTRIVPHFKKDLIKIKKPKSKGRQSSTPSDKFDNNVVDLKRGTDEITVTGWLEDTAISTAWEKFWQIRAMIATGGALANLTVGDIQFTSASQEAFIEELTGTIEPDDTGGIDSSFANDSARINITINFFIGDSR